MSLNDLDLIYPLIVYLDFQYRFCPCSTSFPQISSALEYQTIYPSRMPITPEIFRTKDLIIMKAAPASRLVPRVECSPDFGQLRIRVVLCTSCL